MSIRQAIGDWWYAKRFPELAESFAIESHLTGRERVELFRLAARRPLGVIVEIGSYLGASAAALGAGLRHAANDQARIYCVDTWTNEGMSEGARDTMGMFVANTKPFQTAIVPIRGWSTDVVSQIAGSDAGKIDLLFVDGDHSYGGCLADWQAYGPLLARGARIVFHDVGWAIGVQQVIERHVRPRVTREGRLPNLWWGELQ